MDRNDGAVTGTRGSRPPVSNLRRSNFTRRNRFNRSSLTTYRRGNGPPAISTKAVRQIALSTAKRMLSRRQEDKYFYNEVLAISMGITGGIYDFTPIPQGITDSERVGDTINIKEIEFRWAASMSVGTSLPGGTTFRVTVIQWNQISTSIAFSGVYQGTPFISAFNHDNVEAGNFTVLYDAFKCIGYAGPTNDCDRVTLVPTKKQVEYTAATLNGFGKIYVLISANNTAYAGIDIASNVHYTDS